MSTKIKHLVKKYREIILYGIFGVVTTLANLFTFLFFTAVLGESFYLLNNALAWLAGVIVAFLTNKSWVFGSRDWGLRQVSKEFAEFAAARLFSFGFEEGGMLLFITVLGWGANSFTLFGFEITGQIIVKTLLSVGVVIMNYFFSKFFIFKKNNEKNKENKAN